LFRVDWDYGLTRLTSAFGPPYRGFAVEALCLSGDP